MKHTKENGVAKTPSNGSKTGISYSKALKKEHDQEYLDEQRELELPLSCSSLGPITLENDSTGEKYIVGECYIEDAHGDWDENLLDYGLKLGNKNGKVLAVWYLVDPKKRIPKGGAA